MDSVAEAVATDVKPTAAASADAAVAPMETSTRPVLRLVAAMPRFWPPGCRREGRQACIRKRGSGAEGLHSRLSVENDPTDKFAAHSNWRDPLRCRWPHCSTSQETSAVHPLTWGVRPPSIMGCLQWSYRDCLHHPHSSNDQTLIGLWQQCQCPHCRQLLPTSRLPGTRTALDSHRV